MTVTSTESRTRWVHTGIDAPYPLSITGLVVAEHDRGVAYSAELVHPEHGPVGLISNRGCGDDTRFDAHNAATFSSRDLKQFLGQCTQDGEPMNTDALHELLEEILCEAETAEHVAEARRAGSFLVRSYLPRTASSGPQRGSPVRLTRIALNRAAREVLAGHLDATPGHDVHGPSAYWQMFDGVDWTPLLGAGPLTPEQKNARISRATRFLVNSLQCEPFDEQFHIHGNPAGRFVLIGDTTTKLNLHSWCRCNRPRQRTVRFERWNDLALEESGAVHAATSCRRLVRID